MKQSSPAKQFFHIVGVVICAHLFVWCFDITVKLVYNFNKHIEDPNTPPIVVVSGVLFFAILSVLFYPETKEKK